MASPSFYLKTLGRLSLHAAGPAGVEIMANSKPLAMLAVLATMPGGTASRDYVSELLWPGVSHARARRSLRQALFQLSKRAGVELITADDSTLTLDADLLAVDLWEFDRAMEQAEYETALKLCDGSFLATFDRKIEGELQHWVDAQNGRIGVGREVALNRFVGRALREGDAERAVRAARRYVEGNPLDDAAQATLIRTLRAAGRDVEALQAYEAYRKLLKEALGDEPGGEVERAVAFVREALLSPINGESPGTGVNLSNDALVAEWLARDVKEPSRRDRWLVPGLAGGMAALAVVALGWWVWQSWARSPSGSTALDQVTAAIPVLVGGDGTVAQVGIDPRGVRVEISDTSGGPLAHFRVVAPDGSRAAFAVLDDNGVNIALEDLASGEVTRLTTEAQDEYPVHWSPDSHYVLGLEGRPANDNRDYFYRLVVYDAVQKTQRRLSEVPLAASDPYAAWSPTGTRIAFSGRVADGCRIHVVNFDGSDLRPVSPSWDWISTPAWSPRGDRLAFAAREGGTPHLYVMEADGTDLHRVTSTASDDNWPLWVSDRVLGFISDSGSGSDLWLLDIYTGEAQRVTKRGDVRRTLVHTVPAPASRWVDRIVIRPQIAAVTPGQVVRFEIAALNGLDEHVYYENLPVRWSLTDDRVGELSDGGVLQVRELGQTQVIVSAGGWRADTLELASRALVTRDVEPVLVEDWRRGIRRDLWIRFGDPLPETRPEGGPDGGGVFLNNGDDHYTSGVVSRRAFGLRDGLSIEVWGRLPRIESQWQTLVIDLFKTTPADDDTDWKTANASQLLTLVANSARDSMILAGPDGVSRIARPAPLGAWHLFGLQVDADGRVHFFSDGALRWTTPWRLGFEADSTVHIGIRGASLDAETATGKVRIYEGERYVLPEKIGLSAGAR